MSDVMVCPVGEAAPASVCDGLGWVSGVFVVVAEVIGRPRHGLQCHTVRLLACATDSLAQVACHL